GLLAPTGLVFGPDGNGDGRQDLYVSNSQLTGKGADQARNGTVKRYDGVTGAFIDTFVAMRSGGLSDPNGLFFTETDPITLAYTGASPAIAVSQSAALTAAVATDAGVSGGGRALLTDPAGNTFPLSFSVAGILDTEGSTQGVVDFVFGPAFAQSW